MSDDIDDGFDPVPPPPSPLSRAADVMLLVVLVTAASMFVIVANSALRIAAALDRAYPKQAEVSK